MKVVEFRLRTRVSNEARQVPHPPAVARHQYAGGLFRLLTMVALLLVPASARGQLRPVGPLDWDLLRTGQSVKIGIGLGYLTDQRASLAGTQGNLFEVGNFRIGWSTGRIGLELDGTLLRRFSDQEVLGPPISLPNNHGEPPDNTI